MNSRRSFLKRLTAAIVALPVVNKLAGRIEQLPRVTAVHPIPIPPIEVLEREKLIAGPIGMTGKLWYDGEDYWLHKFPAGWYPLNPYVKVGILSEPPTDRGCHVSDSPVNARQEAIKAYRKRIEKAA